VRGRSVARRTPDTLHHDERTGMASRGKKKTTMAKLNRETKLRDRRLEKKAKKDARKLAPPEDPMPTQPTDTVTGDER
jgi:hypothetical protein